MEADDDLYRIGTIANLTGIAVERLRAWERRYGLEPAHKAGKTRFYSRAQLERLQLIKRLIDQGHPISTLVALAAMAISSSSVKRRTAARAARSGIPAVVAQACSISCQLVGQARVGMPSS